MMIHTALLALTLAVSAMAASIGGPTNAANSTYYDRLSSMGDVGGDPKHDGGRNNKTRPPGKFDRGFLADVKYGPEYGLVPSSIFNFDDTGLMAIENGPKGKYRVLKKLTCFYVNTVPGINIFASSRARLIGLQSVYAVPDVGPGENNFPATTSYHGTTPAGLTVKKSNDYNLIDGETFTSFSLRQCDGHIYGFRAVTNKNTDAISCGIWRKQANEKNCDYKELTTPKGRHVVALYGNAKGTALKDDQGVRGLGLATMTGDCCA